MSKRVLLAWRLQQNKEVRGCLGLHRKEQRLKRHTLPANEERGVWSGAEKYDAEIGKALGD